MLVEMLCIRMKLYDWLHSNSEYKILFEQKKKVLILILLPWCFLFTVFLDVSKQLNLQSN